MGVFFVFLDQVKSRPAFSPRNLANAFFFFLSLTMTNPKSFLFFYDWLQCRSRCCAKTAVTQHEANPLEFGLVIPSVVFQIIDVRYCSFPSLGFHLVDHLGFLFSVCAAPCCWKSDHVYLQTGSLVPTPNYFFFFFEWSSLFFFPGKSLKCGKFSGKTNGESVWFHLQFCWKCWNISAKVKWVFIFPF